MKKNKVKKDLAHYMGLPYTTVLRRDEEGDVVARLQELPGCIAHGKDEGEALNNVRGMQRLWLEDCLEAGHPVPEPEAEESLPSGRWLQRVPRTLHKKLAHIAQREGVSLNQFVTAVLAQAAAHHRRTDDATEPETCKSVPVSRVQATLQKSHKCPAHQGPP